MFGAIAASGVLPFARERVRGRRSARRGAAPRRASPASRAAGMRCASRATPPAAPVARRRAIAAAPRRRRRPSRRRFPRPTRDIAARGLRARSPNSRIARYAELYLRARWRACSPPSAAADPRRRTRLRADARDGALPRAVDGVRRHRARRRPQVPRQPLRARAARGRRAATATSCASSTTSSRACPEFAALLPRGARARGSSRGTAGAQARGKPPLALRAARCARTASPASSRCALLASLRGLRRRGARYRGGAGGDRALARRGRRTAPRADWALRRTRSRCAGASSRATARPTSAASAICRTSSTHLARGDEPSATRASAIREAREAALADEGKALDRALRHAHGAPPRPARRSRPWTKTRRTAATTGRPPEWRDAHDPLHRRVRRLRSGADRLLSELPPLDRCGVAALLPRRRRAAVAGARGADGIIGTPLVDVSARFVVPATYGDEIAVESRSTSGAARAS